MHEKHMTTHTKNVNLCKTSSNYTHTKKSNLVKGWQTLHSFPLPSSFFLISQCFWATYRHIYVFCSGESGLHNESKCRHRASAWISASQGCSSHCSSLWGSVPIASILIWDFVRWAHNAWMFLVFSTWVVCRCFSLSWVAMDLLTPDYPQQRNKLLLVVTLFIFASLSKTSATWILGVTSLSIP